MQRRPSKTTRGINAAERRWMQFVKGQSNCIACKAYGPVIGHHCAGSAAKIKVDLVTVVIGMWFVIPLCQRCDDLVTHGSRRRLTDKYGPQRELWARLIKTWTGEVPPEIITGIMESGL